MKTQDIVKRLYGLAGRNPCTDYSLWLTMAAQRLEDTGKALDQFYDAAINMDIDPGQMDAAVLDYEEKVRGRGAR